jgi:hypothetical protein
MELRLQVETAVQITRAFAAAPVIVMDELETAMGSALLYLQRETVENTPSDLGTLRNAFITDVYVSTGLDAVFGTLSNPLPYALPVELGTKPHSPPLDPLIGWVERKLDLFGDEAEAAARAIQRKIGRVGSPGYGMARFALIDGASTIQAEFAEAAARITARIAAEGSAL